MKLDGAAFGRVSLSLPGSEPALASLDDGPALFRLQLRNPAERRPSRFEVVKAPEAFDATQPQMASVDQLAATCGNFNDNDEACRY